MYLIAALFRHMMKIYDQSQSPVACHEDNRQGRENPEMLFVSANMSHLQKDRKQVLDNHQNLNVGMYLDFKLVIFLDPVRIFG